MKFELPITSAQVLVRRPGARVAETVHALLDAGASVDVLAAPGDSATLDDLASRQLVRLVTQPDPDRYDMVLRDPLADAAEGDRKSVV